MNWILLNAGILFTVGWFCTALIIASKTFVEGLVFMDCVMVLIVMLTYLNISKIQREEIK